MTWAELAPDIQRLSVKAHNDKAETIRWLEDARTNTDTTEWKVELSRLDSRIADLKLAILSATERNSRLVDLFDAQLTDSDLLIEEIVEEYARWWAEDPERRIQAVEHHAPLTIKQLYSTIDHTQTELRSFKTLLDRSTRGISEDWKRPLHEFIGWIQPEAKCEFGVGKYSAKSKPPRTLYEDYVKPSQIVHPVEGRPYTVNDCRLALNHERPPGLGRSRAFYEKMRPT